MAESAAPLLSTLRAIVGEINVLTSDADVAPYVSDWRDRYHGRARAVVRPGTTAEVAAVVRCCAEHGVPIVPQGGNTGLCGGATPDESGGEIVVSLSRLARVRAIDTSNATLTIEAGVPLARAQQAADDAGFFFPLSLGAEGSCTIGGNLSTNAGGTAALAYGVAREMALGLEVVLSDGRVLNVLSKLKKDNTGYDLRNLFIGAEGTLGIITAATLKLFPKPHAVETAFVGLKSPAAALKLLSISLNEAAGTLTSFELLSDIAVDFSLRHEMSAAQKPEGGSIKHDISVPVAAVPAFIEEANAAVVKLIPGSRPVPFGHLGDGNLHYNVSQPVGGDTADFMSRWHEVNEVVFAIVLRMGGSISAEHGIGVLKRDELPDVKDKVAIELMRGIKAMLDPLGIMNPGKVL